MKNLELEQMECQTGGDFIDGACTGVGIATLAFFAGAISFGAGAAFVLGVAGGVCVANEIANY